MRRIAWVGLVTAALGCTKQAPPPRPPAPPPAEAEASPPPPPSPTEVLSGIHHTAVTISESISVPEGFIVGYWYGRADALIGEMEDGGIDVLADIDEAEAECERERAAMSEDERQYIDIYDEPECSQLALGKVLDDEVLALGCNETGLAYFDLQGHLLRDELVGSGCTGPIATLKLRRLAPGAEPSLLLTMSADSQPGHYSRGGWGFRVEEETLYVIELVEDEDGPGFFVSLDLRLDRYEEGGNCADRISGGVGIDDQRGTIDHYTLAYNECDDEGCLDREMVEDYRESEGLGPDDDLDIEVCEPAQVQLERYVWQPDTGEWDVSEDVDSDDGDPLEEIPSNLDY